MMKSDGVVFASPNYSFHVSAIMTTFLDRLGFVFHRPRFFGKTSTSVDSDFFYPVRLNVLKKAAGSLFDTAASRSAKQ
jgi:multimeric flavodoxin WrbA